MGKKGAAPLTAVASTLTGNLWTGAFAANQARKELAGIAAPAESVGAGNADAARSEAKRKEDEARRRSFLGLNNTSPMGVVNPLTPKRPSLGGY